MSTTTSQLRTYIHTVVRQYLFTTTYILYPAQYIRARQCRSRYILVLIQGTKKNMIRSCEGLCIITPMIRPVSHGPQILQLLRLQNFTYRVVIRHDLWLIQICAPNLLFMPRALRLFFYRANWYNSTCDRGPVTTFLGQR